MSDPITRLNAALEGRYRIETPRAARQLSEPQSLGSRPLLRQLVEKIRPLARLDLDARAGRITAGHLERLDALDALAR